jgi:hypothetical protein
LFHFYYYFWLTFFTPIAFRFIFAIDYNFSKFYPHFRFVLPLSQFLLIGTLSLLSTITTGVLSSNASRVRVTTTLGDGDGAATFEDRVATVTPATTSLEDGVVELTFFVLIEFQYNVVHLSGGRSTGGAHKIFFHILNKTSG